METAERKKKYQNQIMTAGTLCLPLPSCSLILLNNRPKKMPAYGQVQGAFMPFYSCALLINYDDVAAV